MRIGFGSDHVAVERKNCLLKHMKQVGLTAAVLFPVVRIMGSVVCRKYRI